MKFLGPLTRSGYVRIGSLIIVFYVCVQWLTSYSSFNRTLLIEDLRVTAQELAALSGKQQAPTPETLSVMQRRGIISEDLLHRCQQAKVTFHQENVDNHDGLPVFSIPDESSASATHVTASGLFLR